MTPPAARRRLLASLAAALGLSAGACAPVESMPDNTCGNGVIEKGEDCDIHPAEGYDCVAPGDPWQCSFVCAEGRCPPGYGCGTDNVCRKPAGQIASVPFAEVPSPSRQLFAGDFDADRRMDIVGFEPGRARVFFLGAAGDVQQVSFSAFIRPSIGKLGPLPGSPGDADTTDDLCQSLNLGVGASLSDGDRTFTAKTYGSITIEGPPGLDLEVTGALPLAFDALPGAAQSGDETGALVSQVSTKTGDPLPFGAFVNFGAGPADVVLLVQDGLPENLAGPPVHGNFDVSDACEELVFAIKAGDGVNPAVRVYSPCEPEQDGKSYRWRRAKSPSEGLLAEIQTTHPVNGPVFPFDANGDGRLDLLITVAIGAGGSAGLEVAYGVGDGSFHSKTPVPPLAGPAPAGDNHTSFYATMSNGQAPLAIGDLNLDGLPDAVDPTQVLLGALAVGGAGVLTFTPLYQSQRTWTEAVIADINANGRPDVLACAAGAPDIDVLNGNLPNVYNPSQIVTKGAASKLTVGDFDGDLVDDIAYHDAISKSKSLLSIAYGRTAGGPEEPVEVGRFSGIDHIVRGNVHTFGIDNITDLGVASRSAAGKIAMSFFPGDGNRVVQSPFLLTEASGKVHVPLLTALGSVRERAAGEELHNDLAVLAYNPPQISQEEPTEVQFEKATTALRLWGLFGTGEADFDTTASVFCDMPRGALFLPGFEETASLVVSRAETRRAGRVFAAVPSATLHPDGKGADVGSILVEAVLKPGGTCEVIDAKAPPFAGKGELLFRVQTANLDGDGEPEVLALLRTYDPEELGERVLNAAPGKQISPVSSRLVIFWDGVLGSGAELALNIPPGQPATVSDFTTGDIDGDGRPEVIVVGADKAVVYRLGPDAASLVVDRSLDADAAGADAVLLADADGDGVKDLVVARGGLRFFKGQPRPEVKNPAGE